MKIIFFHLDGVLCTNTFGDYENAIPIKEAILKNNFLYNKWYVIKIFTAIRDMFLVSSKMLF